MAIKVQNETVIYDDKTLKTGGGTVAQRPANPQAGLLRFNPESGLQEGYDGTKWVRIISYNASITNPTVFVEGAPSSVRDVATISTTAFAVTAGRSVHASTDWEVRRTSDNALIYSSYNNTTNKTSITLPGGVLQPSTQYYFRARFNGTGDITISQYGSTTATTRANFFPSVGESYCGGYYFGAYNRCSTCYALVVAPNSFGASFCRWKTTCTTSSGTSNSYTSTYVNNNSTFPSFSWAASRVINGYTDWYVPDTFETTLMYNNNLCFPSGERFSGCYWTDAEISFLLSRAISFVNGTCCCVIKTGFRCVRAMRRQPI